MLNQLLKTIPAFLVPGGLIFIAAFGFLRPGGLPPWLQQPVAALPYVVLAFGLIFGWYFSSSRIILSLVILSLADRALFAFPLSGSDPNPLGPTIFSATAFLLPLNLLAFSILKEDAVSTIRGAIRTFAVMVQPFLVLWLCDPGQRDIAAALQLTYIHWLPTGWTPIPQAALLAFVVAGPMHAIRFALYRNALDGGAAWALAAVFLAYHGVGHGWRPTNFFSTAGLILFVALIQSSYQQAYRDDLTGISGRLAYEEATAQLGKQFVIAVLSVDQLKSYANTHGKSVAEQILKLVAPKVQTACQGGRVFRVSGEELTLLFHDQSAMEALVTLDQVRKAVESTSLFLRGRDRVWEDTRVTPSPGNKDRELPVTLSIGVTEASTEKATLGGEVSLPRPLRRQIGRGERGETSARITGSGSTTPRDHRPDRRQ
jgi:GGDEF domain-containing protein